MSRPGVAVSLACVAAMAVARSQEAPPWDPSPHRVRFVEVDRNVTLEVLDWGGVGRPIVLLAVTDSGGLGAPKTPPAVAQAISAGSKRFTSIGVPALAIFASPHRLGPWTDAHPDRRAAFEAFARFDQAMTERQAAAFERGVTGARVIRLPNASHYMFITEEAAVLREIIAFLHTLAEPMSPERSNTACSRRHEAIETRHG